METLDENNSNEERLATKLFHGSIDLLWNILRARSPTISSAPGSAGGISPSPHKNEEWEQIRQLLETLYFWGQGFARRSRLDAILDLSAPLKWQVMSLLIDISRAIISLFEHHELILEIRIFTQCLIDLTPCLEYPAPDPPIIEEEERLHREVGGEIQSVALPWCRRIFDMFPAIDTTLGEHLGILNWKRFDRCRSWAADPASKVIVGGIPKYGPSETIDHETAPTTTMEGTTTGHPTSTNTGTNLDTEITAPDNDFDDHFEPHPGKMGRREEFDLETVLTSSTHMAGTFRVPDMPNEDQDGSRTCSVCKNQLSQSVQTRTDWKRHIYHDLEPYTCTSPDCATSGVDTFSNRQDWAEHEFQHHLAEKVWMCSACSARMSTKEAFSNHLERNHPEYTWVEEHIAVELSENTGLYIKSPLICPMCKVTLEPSLQVYAKHVGRHLEQIALIVVQTQNMDESLEENDTGTETTSSISYAEDDEMNSPLARGDDAAVNSPLARGDDAAVNSPLKRGDNTAKLDNRASHGQTLTSVYEAAPMVSSTLNYENAAILPEKTKTRRSILRKVAVLGSRSAGKSSLVVQFVDGHYVESYYPTIENTFIKRMWRGDQAYSVEIVDAAGQDEYSILNSKHFIGIHGYMLVYSVRSRASFEMVQVIREKILNHLGTEWVPIVVVGTQSDSQSKLRQVSTEEGKQLCEKWNCAWTEASARYNENVGEAFEMLLSEIEKSQDPDRSASNRCITM
ncbi:hypothetical protein PFICI_13933 [Pestalotiopsis fici W106-1]|uniref:C2H2-type domain-containing protein n=1 Tax=Pestalotiopsis fici (strain W106-1 / CGMCC3.15140) TaxID=1229662 RepID=W3WLL0_PESFW|nr:uncharacterized protein PFICI_13933 [Pestalotiopsis fici W106-1]ETS74067.1 hypothetical protein PFICI_13933 [Pestalotiopsis fici W106-1]